MVWTEVNITLPHDAVASVTSLLTSLGEDSFAVTDYADLEEVLDHKGCFYDYIDDALFEKKDASPVITLYFEKSPQGFDRLFFVKSAMRRYFEQNGGERAYDWEEKSVADSDFDQVWKQYFKPLPIADSFCIKPTWEVLPDELKEGRHVLEIDPEAAFGTGSHATTRMCIEAIEDLPVNGASVLDAGCGSGILGIAALLAGANSLCAVDIDETAVRIAKENITRNGCDRFSPIVACCDITSDDAQKVIGDKPFDLIFANIVADVIIFLAKTLFSLTGEGGHLVASGILDEKASGVIETLKSVGFRILSTPSSDGWTAIVAQKSGGARQ